MINRKLYKITIQNKVKTPMTLITIKFVPKYKERFK